MRLIFSFYNKFRQHAHDVTVKHIQIVICQQEPLLSTIIRVFQNMAYWEKKETTRVLPRVATARVRLDALNYHLVKKMASRTFWAPASIVLMVLSGSR